MTLLDKLPKDADGFIILSPGGEIDGEPVEATVDTQWFANNFAQLATASVPLSDVDFASLKAVDAYWSQNAESWRTEGII